MAAVLLIALICSGIALMVLLSGIALYNRLVTLRSLVRAARADMEAVARTRQSAASGQTGTAVQSGSPDRHRLDEVLQAYDEAVWAYNTAVETFPASLMARRFGLRKEEPLGDSRGQAPSS